MLATLPPIGPFLWLALVLLVVGSLTCAAAVALAAWSLLHPPRMTDGKALYLLRRLSPADVGLTFEDVTFTVRDEPTGRPVRIAGWWMPREQGSGDAGNGGGDAGRCAVLIHGYADAKVGAVAWAPVWHDLGFHVLAIDLRAHGESGGRASTGGWLERHDVAQVLDQLRAERPDQARQVVLFGVSLGAAVALATAALQEADARPVGDAPHAADAPRAAHGIAGIVLDSPFADFRRAADTHMDRLALSVGWMRRAAIALAERLTRADLAALRPVDLLGRVACPVMVVAPEEDRCLTDGDAEALEKAVKARPGRSSGGVWWRVAGASHATALAVDPAEYRRRLAEFVTSLDDARCSTAFGPPG